MTPILQITFSDICNALTPVPVRSALDHCPITKLEIETEWSKIIYQLSAQGMTDQSVASCLGIEARDYFRLQAYRSPANGLRPVLDIVTRARAAAEARAAAAQNELLFDPDTTRELKYKIVRETAEQVREQITTTSTIIDLQDRISASTQASTARRLRIKQWVNATEEEREDLLYNAVVTGLDLKQALAYYGQPYTSSENYQAIVEQANAEFVYSTNRYLIEGIARGNASTAAISQIVGRNIESLDTDSSDTPTSIVFNTVPPSSDERKAQILNIIEKRSESKNQRN